MVTDSKVDMIEVKLIVSAVGPTELASLRAAILEAMLEWLREHMPAALGVVVPNPTP